MTSLRRELLRPATWIALLALAVALGGTAYAAGTINSADIVDGSIQSIDIGTDQVLGADIKANAVTGAEVANASIAGVDVKDGSLARADISAGSTLPRTVHATLEPGEQLEVFDTPGINLAATCAGTPASPVATLTTNGESTFAAGGTSVRSDLPDPVKLASTSFVSATASATTTSRVAQNNFLAVDEGLAYDLRSMAMVEPNEPCRFVVVLAQLGPAA